MSEATTIDGGGAGAVMTPMPSFVGMPIDRARRILKIMGLKGSRMRLVEVSQGRGRVAEQSPPAGAPIPTDPAQIELVVESENPDRLLPEIYREWDLSRTDYKGNGRPIGVLKRFLYIPQQVYGEVDSWADVSERNFAADTAPDAFLPFLESLFPFQVFSGWSVRRRREVLYRLPELLRKRGTAEGLELMVELYTDIKVKIHELEWPYKGMVVGGPVIGEQPIVSQVPSPLDAFYVELPSRDLPREVIERIHRVIDTEKPAHLLYCLYAPPEQKVMEEGRAAIGVDFIMGVSKVPGQVTTEPASIKTRGSLPRKFAPNETWRPLDGPEDG